MKNENKVNALFEFIKNSPSAYHAVASVRDILVANGFAELCEGGEWNLSDGGKYFAVRNGTSIIAFKYKKSANGFMICASHSDSPAFRVKASGESDGAYTRLPVERYGGMIMYSWLDRPLSIAGRVVYKTERGIKSTLLNVDRDLLVIPSVAIHLNRGVNESFAPNAARDMIPLYAGAKTSLSLKALISEELAVAPEAILSHDLFLYARDAGRVFGAEGEFILSPRLDDLACVYTSLAGFVGAADNVGSIPVLAVFDNEEVGSDTKQGAASTFLCDTLSKIAPEKYSAMLSNSFMVSADNAHAKHPNRPDLADAENAPILGGGVVVKYNANQKYATDGISAALFELIAERAGEKLQTYYNRADMPGGSTLGSISNTKVSISTVDIGIPQLAMHSAVETAAVSDVSSMEKILGEFYSSAIAKENDEIIIK